MTLTGTILKKEVLEILEATSIEQLKRDHSDFRRFTLYSQPFGHWKLGTPRPVVSADGPAEANAIGRCVANRVRYGLMEGVNLGNIHSSECGWCAYPKDVLLAALDHAIVISQHVEADYLVWRTADKSRDYTRDLHRAGEYDNPRWADFWRGVSPSTSKHPPEELAAWAAARRESIDVATGRVA
jgi:hypothetical protein